MRGCLDRTSTYVLVLVLFLVLMPRSVSAAPDGSQGGPSAELPPETIHVVQRGETLFAIAQRYGSTVDALAHANGLHDPTRIYVGQRLKIPDVGVEMESQVTTSYVVQAGDSLSSVARRHVTSWQNLASLNLLLSPSVLYPGQVIQVPVVDRVAHGGSLYLAGAGETFFEIALRYDVPPWSLVRANDWVNPALIYLGQPLLVPGDSASGLPMPFGSVDVEPLPAAQGSSLVIAVRTTGSVTLTGRLFGRAIHFAEENGVHYALVGVHLLAEPGLYEGVLTATDGDGRLTQIPIDFVVEAGQFGYERIPASPSLLDPAVVAAESERLDALRPLFSARRMWSAKFEPPCGGTVSSYFGTHRAYNEGPYTSYHGGVDLRGSTGTPVHAPAAGTVVLADELVVRGNALLLDHGWGVLTGYWHLSTIEVEVGQRVEQGDLIGRIGNTGLSTGSHLHWEMWVGGVKVDPLQWLVPVYPWP